jgi:hypothetical protein
MELEWGNIVEEFPVNNNNVKPYTGIPLYNAWSYVNNYAPGIDNLKFSWFASDRQRQNFNYSNALVFYDDQYSLGYIDELLTLEEVLELKDYLMKTYCSELFYKEVQLPITYKIAGFNAMPFGGGDDFYLLHKDSEYNLSIKIEAFFSKYKNRVDDLQIKSELNQILKINENTIDKNFLKQIIIEDRSWLISTISKLFTLDSESQDLINSYFVMNKLIGG